MPVPLNAFLDVAKAWFTEKLGYLVNDSVPVIPEYVGKPNTASDIDLICIHPKGEQTIEFESGRKMCLSRNLLIECKGWFDFTKTQLMTYLINDIDLLKKHRSKYFPIHLTKDDFQFFFLRKEIYKKGKKIFGTSNFQRVIICPLLVPTKNSSYTVNELLLEFKKRGIIIIEMKDIISDLFKFINNAVEKNKRRHYKDKEDRNKLRRTYALEMLHLVNTFCDVNQKMT